MPWRRLLGTAVLVTFYLVLARSGVIWPEVWTLGLLAMGGAGLLAVGAVRDAGMQDDRSAVVAEAHAITFREANAVERKRHRQNIKEFRQANEDQARMMMDVSNDLMNIIQRRIAKAEEEDENIPMGLLSGLMRAASQISDTGRQAWATSLGVSELMQVVDQELEEAANVEEVDVYEIPLDE